MNAKKRPAVVLLGVWDLAWRVWAIRRAVQYKQWKWVVALLVVNSMGILPMVYLKKFAHPELENVEGADEFNVVRDSS